MEVSNIEGSYRITCEAVMRVIRDNKESLMAVLEAVSMISVSIAPYSSIVLISHKVHPDPLLNWRLGNRESPPQPSFPSERRQSIIGGFEAAQVDRGESYRPRRAPRSKLASPIPSLARKRCRMHVRCRS
jgi:FKBP12-rapamycin complex-associated protein